MRGFYVCIWFKLNCNNCEVWLWLLLYIISFVTFDDDTVTMFSQTKGTYLWKMQAKVFMDKIKL